MKHLKDKEIKAILILLPLLAAMTSALMSCAPTFDDESKSILKKPEILSITLDPPEASPGETVRARFLAADQFGAISEAPSGTTLLQLWMMSEPGASSFASGAIDNGSLSSAEKNDDTDNTVPDLSNIGITPIFDFSVYPDEDYKFNEAGFAPQLLTLLFFPEGADPATLQDKDKLSKIQDMLESGKAQLALRTLVVSNRSSKNRNPRITAAFANAGDSSPKELTFLHSDSENIAAERAAATADPFIVTYKKKLRLHFSITVEDEGDPEDVLLFQWISNAGEFRLLPKSERDWIVPEYVEPEEGFSDQSGLEFVDQRKDPNLHPIWVIVRDSGVENQLGQSWAEFYVRVQKP